MIVTAASAAEWGEEAVLELADLVGRFRPRTIVINTVPGGRGPDRILGCEAAAGLTAISRGEAVVRDVARSPADRPFLYVPAGQPAEVLGELAHRPAFLHLLKAAARGGTLLLHASEEDLGALIGQPDGRAALHAFDGYVIFGDRSTFAPPLSGVPLLARVERPIPGSRLSDAVEQDTAGSAFAPALAEISGRRRRQGRTRRLWSALSGQYGLRLAGRVTGIWLMVAVGFSLGWLGLAGWPPFTPDIERLAGPGAEASSDEAVPGSPDEVPGSPEASPPAAVPDSSRSEEPAASVSIPIGGVALPYSVLVDSYFTWDDAAQRRDELSRDGRLAFVAPTPIRDRLYYRVFAGALEDRIQAGEAMRELVESGDKEREHEWDMRPVRLAYLLGDFEVVDQAIERGERLHESRIPAYVLAVVGASGATYRVYSGAFESEAAAALLDSLLTAAGVPATLETRRGEPR
jgi:cell division septation protein DedD